MSNQGKQLIGYIGTYTKGESKGIYSFKLDTKEAKINDIKLAAEADNPTYLTITIDNQYLYSVVKEGDAGGVAAFTVNSETGELSPINSQVSAGSPPCHVSLDDQGEYAFTANYHKGTVEAYEINKETGQLHPVSCIVAHEGSGPDPRQEKPHTHYAGITPDGKNVIAVELGIDAVLTYKLIEGTLIEQSRLDVKPGSGPRHLTFHPNGKFAYVMTEFSSEVITLAYDGENGAFTQLQTISTLPEEFTENNQGSAIHISSDGKFVYAGNRGHNSICIFSVNNDTGILSFVERTLTEGDWPRDFVLDPTEEFLIASNQNSSNIVLYARNKETGTLKVLQSDITVPDPVCVKFLNL